MAVHYSAAQGAFYDDRHHAVLPDDAVVIADTRHRALLAAQATGAQIVADDEGRPRLFRPRPSVAARRQALIAQVKREAARRIALVAPLWRQLNDMRAPCAAGQARFVAIDAIRAASALIEADIAARSAEALTSIDIPTHPAWLESE